MIKEKSKTPPNEIRRKNYRMSSSSRPSIRPIKPAPLDRYCRLFSPVEPAFDPCAMTSLGLSMKGDISNLPSIKTTLLAGFTYFGQFIDHDLTRDDTLLEDAGKLSPVETVNGGGGRLDLSHLYGDGPGSSTHGHLYDSKGAFRLGDILSNGVKFDLWLKDGKPQSADDRSTENIFLRQLCAMFMNLHNLAIDHPLPDDKVKEPFEAARTRVRWQYQWIIRHEFLATICLYDVYRDLAGDQGYEAKSQMIDWESDGFAIPVEFSHAAFRFGHSLVRPKYNINSVSLDIALGSLFGSPQTPGPLPASLAVDWYRFFDGSQQEGPELAMAIDTVIASPLFHLPSEHLHHLIAENATPLPPELPVRTLRRGAAVGLASGEEVAEKLGRDPLRPKQPEGYERTLWANLDELGLTERTPLWYYVLLEAELENKGQKLGTIGSRLIAEVVEGALRTDAESFLAVNGPQWAPPTWIDWRGDPIEIRTLIDVASAVGLAQRN
jgi:hypothetical protein